MSISGRIIIESVDNGYIVDIRRVDSGSNAIKEMGRYVARSWDDVLQLLKDIEAPDFVQDVS